METQEKNMELNEESPNVGMKDSQSGRTPDQTDNEVRLESELVEFTESNENNETVQIVTVNCEPADVNLEFEFNDNNEFTESEERFWSHPIYMFLLPPKHVFLLPPVC